MRKHLPNRRGLAHKRLDCRHLRASAGPAVDFYQDRQNHENMKPSSLLRKCMAAVLLAPTLVLAQSPRSIEVGQYLARAYTDNFTRSVEYLLSGEAQTPSGAMKTIVSGSQKPGKRIARFGQEWTVVEETGLLIIGSERIDSTHQYFHDPRTGLPGYKVDQEDESLGRYEWTQVPQRLTVGESVVAGKLTETNKDGKLVAVGLVWLRATEVKEGLEFCQIESMIEAESGDKRMTEDCTTFDAARRPVATRASIEIDAKPILQASGTIRLR